MTTGVPDAERNRVLRRADWRFLLPTPAPERSICFAPGALAEATQAISSSVVGAESGDARASCDLAVASDPSRATLRQARESLRPGGALYVEWNAGWKRPASIRRRLEQAGFESVTCYAPRPTPSRGTEVWVPLESDGAVRHFLAHQSRRQRGPRGLLQAARGALWRADARLRWACPVCSVALRPVTDRVERRATPAWSTRPTSWGLSADLEAELLAGWEGWSLGPEPRELASLLVTRGRRSINKAVTVLFAGSDPRPVAAIKRARVPESSEPMWHEAGVLREIHRRPAGMRGAPQVLFCKVLDGVPTLGETFLAGRPVAELVGAHNYRALALQAADWSADLAGQSEPKPPDAWRARLLDPVIAQFEECFGPVLERGVFREALRLLESLPALPLVCEQRDFSPWNLLRSSRDELGVLDWESSEAQGLPALDLIYYLTYLSSYLDRSIYTGDLRQARRRCLDPASAMGALAQECLDRYLKRLGLDAAPLHALSVLAWMIHARSDYRHFCLDQGTAPGADLLRTSRFLRLWYQELGASPGW